MVPFNAKYLIVQFDYVQELSFWQFSTFVDDHSAASVLSG